MSTNQEAFLSELTELTKKYGIIIGGCGCCGSPWLVGNKVINPNDSYQYCEGSGLQWDDFSSIFDHEE